MAQIKQLTKKEQRKLEKQKKKEACEMAGKAMRDRYRDLLKTS